MNDYKVSDYSIFGEGASIANSTKSSIDGCKTKINSVKSILDDDSVFMGPIADSCVSAFPSVESGLSSVSSNFSSISSYLNQTSSSYQAADQEASSGITGSDSSSSSSLSLSGISSSSSATPVSSVEIPDDINQSGYTVTCYGEGGWYLGGGSKATPVASGTNQKSVHEAWLEDGARYKNGIAVLNVDGEDHYLIATAPTFGTVGDNVNVNLHNGETIPCIIADSKSTADSNYTKYGHRSGNSVNVLEFEVDRNKYNESKNPKTETWGLEWDSNSTVAKIDNYGSIL